MIKIININESKVYLDCNQGILKELSDAFSFQVPGYKFMQSYKLGMFDGWIRMIDRRNQTAPKGLVPDIVRWAIDFDYKVIIDPLIVATFKKEFKFDVAKLPLPFPPRQYQVETVERFLEKKRQIIISPTGSGKSLSIYLCVRAMQQILPDRFKVIIVVPSVQLVNQLYSDFDQYSQTDDHWFVSDNVHKIYSGEDKETDKQVVITTWQSVYKLPSAYFKQFGCVIGDEVHLFDGKSCTSILDKCVNAFFRLGTTGTLDGTKISEIQLKALFGPIYQVATTRELIDDGKLAEIEIKAIILNHREEVCKAARGLTYQDEIDYVVRMENRNAFLANLAGTRKGNVLLMYRFVEKHGKQLYETVKKMYPNRRVLFVHGNVDPKVRESIRAIIESNDDVIVVASEGTFAVGVNVVNISHVIFGSPNKSKTRVLQTIGRGLRKGKGKDKMYLYDVVDNLKGSYKKENYGLLHFQVRYQYYQEQQFPVEIKEYNIE